MCSVKEWSKIHNVCIDLWRIIFESHICDTDKFHLWISGVNCANILHSLSLFQLHSIHVIYDRETSGID